VSKIYVIAEIGINHNGDMDLAKQLISIAKSAGCNAVKFQKRTIKDVYTEKELNRPRESPWGTTNREQKEGLEFSIEQYRKLQDFSVSLGLDFIVSCWDVNSVDLIEEYLNIKYHKVASASITDHQFLKKLNLTGRPVILSTGMSNQRQVDAAMEILDNVEYVLACTSTYPTKADELNLSYIKTLKGRFTDCKVGFSNHYNGHDACVAAAALGAECIEFHITHDRAAYGSDQSASIENSSELVRAIRKVEMMLGDGIKKIYKSEVPIAEKLRKIDDTLS